MSSLKEDSKEAELPRYDGGLIVQHRQDERAVSRTCAPEGLTRNRRSRPSVWLLVRVTHGLDLSRLALKERKNQD